MAWISHCNFYFTSLNRKEKTMSKELKEVLVTAITVAGQVVVAIFANSNRKR